MSFLYPDFFWLLIPLGILLWQAHSKLLYLTHLIILILLVFALARPIEKQVLQERDIEAKDIIIALDVSYSMQATDLYPTRYAFAKETIKALLAQNHTDNIMLIAFTSNPLLLSPPTTDHALVNMALESLNPEYILTKGTSLKKLFIKLNKISLANKHLILITDGGEEKNLNELHSTLKDSQFFLHVLALGTQQGSTVKNKEGKVLTDKEGNLVITRINPLLKHLTTALHGNYLLPSSTPEATAFMLDKHLSSTVLHTQNIQKMHYAHKEWYQLPLALALLLFFLLHTKGAKYLLLLFSFLGLPLHASIFDFYHLQQAYTHYEAKAFLQTHTHLLKIEYPSLQSQLLLANSYFRQNNFKQAIATYKAIQSRSASIKQMLYYNIATSYARLKVYDKAKIYYTKTLQLGIDEDALHNLRLIALLENKKDASLGIAHPKSQSPNSSKSEKQNKDNETLQNEDQPSESSGGDGKKSNKEKEKEKSKLISDDKQEKQPLSSKVYDLINKGYIRETQPW